MTPRPPSADPALDRTRAQTSQLLPLLLGQPRALVQEQRDFLPPTRQLRCCTW
ncbi:MULTISPECIES: hypothetical protein [unclassified Streptomyces]|uniref:hypothetical protein n=1 Tax=unclassified Streptomyces TaxID=2593676 RepID=UPI00131CD082|nr:MULTISPECIES: hypothetical protein [unclassified Streptomyces]